MNKILSIALVAAVTVLILFPFFKDGFFPTHDGTWAVVRLSEMVREIKDGQIPPRMAGYLNHGYGYPLFNFTYPLPFYFGSVLKVLGFGYVDSVKAVFIMSTLAAGIFMYLLVSGLGGNTAGLVSAILYLVLPYRFVNLYVRGSIGEILAMGLYPAVFYLIFKIVLKPSVLKITALSFSYFLLFTSHNISALIFFPFSLLFFVILVLSFYEDFGRNLLKFFLPSLILGFFMSSYFLLPAIFERGYTGLSNIGFKGESEGFIAVGEFFTSVWNFGIRPSFQLGWVHILIFFLSLSAYLISGSVQRKKNLYIMIFVIFSVLVSLSFTQSAFFFLWKIPLLASVDFPWRFMGVLSFFISMSAVFLSQNRYIKYSAVFFCIAAVILGVRFAKPQYYINQPDDYYISNDATTTSADELMPVWVVNKPSNRFADKVEIISGQGKIENISYNSKSINLNISNSSPVSLKINQIFYPGWKFFLNGQMLTPEYSNPEGLIFLNIDTTGGNHISGIFTETLLRFVSDLMSAGGFLVFFILLLSGIRLKLKKSSG